MAERVPSSPPPPPQPPTLNLHDPSISPSPPVFESGTYVVQVPKDQIYHVPPAENALLFERHRNPPQKKRRSCYYSLCFCCCLVIVFLVIAIGLGIGLSFALFKSENPEFLIQSFVVKTQTTTTNPDYEIRLKVKNPNQKLDILYVHGGIASLLHNNEKLATGKFPTFHQEESNLTEIGIVLEGQNIESAKPKTHVSLSLAMEIPAKMKTSSFKTGEVNFVIICEFAVDTLGKGTKLLSQQCHTNR
ncbi:NDR1/HIN1-like protein 13 [Mercurialis annua]|uniref:NDR1/HIN1-like protein 13 n=1 Tax=Mercurialis annua TaxID=3986 RepID=UPI00215F1705|nr:NDR1/HIN1-like protein 13 [Mercurialis annua]